MRTPAYFWMDTNSSITTIKYSIEYITQDKIKVKWQISLVLARRLTCGYNSGRITEKEILGWKTQITW
jgi:hypothetical protein